MSQLKPTERLFLKEVLLLIAAILLSLSWLAPNHEMPWLTFHVEILAASSGLFFFLYVSVCGYLKNPRISTASIVLLICAIVPFTQWAVGIVSYFGDALVASLYCALVAVLFWTGSVAEKEDSNRITSVLAFAMLWSAIFSTGVALGQKFAASQVGIFFTDPNADERALGNLGQPNHLATLLVFGMAAAAWLRAQGKLSSWCAGLSASFICVGLALTESRQPLLGFLILGSWSLGAASLRRFKLRDWIQLLAILIWLGFAYFIFNRLAIYLDDSIPVDPYRLRVGLRPLLWNQFLHAVLNSPWLGYGWQGGLTAQAADAIAHPGLEVSAYAHNLFLDLLVWNGIPLGMLLIVAFLLWYWKTGCSVRQAGGWFQFAIVTFLLSHSLLEFPFAYSYFLVPAALAAGQIEGKSRRVQFGCPIWIIPLVSILATGSLFLIINDYLSLSEERRELIIWKISLGGDHPKPEKPRIFVLNQLSKSIEWMRSEPTSGMSDAEVDEQSKLSLRFPTVPILSRTIIVYGLNKRSEAAYAELLRLRGIAGNQYYNLVVARVRSLANTSQPTLLKLVSLIDMRSKDLPPVPVRSEELSKYSFSQ